MGLFKKKSWEPRRVEPIGLEQAKKLSVVAMYKGDEGMTGSEIAQKFTDPDGEAFAYCDFIVERTGKGQAENLTVYVVDTDGRKHFIGYIGYGSKPIYKEIINKKPKYKFMRLNCVGNVDLYFVM